MDVPARAIGSISRRLQSALAPYEDVDAIRAWFFVIMAAWSMLVALEKGREILRWIMKLAQAFPKEVRFLYYRILRGFKELLGSLRDPLTILVSQPGAP